ncbi:Zn-dependent hydrolase [Peptoniphilus indolicus]|uniref:N-carbamyl-L-cysteine amidohydrolase n=2 Tax=Peptoniphilus indolicus TaxID=33030 RepID=G4D2H7_9FIRM|nr:Zn-dependent hydrolase [Peptoniphilus indolicus]EGY80254.1 N-carbamyl-L-cysteine amidohydrolase [Peptoniphilus indolicus ATCC 29427]SUB75310.1 N-carbamoyl-L-amino acid hydrolase [Peptoniphilus indolicus]
MKVNGERLLNYLKTLGEIGRDQDGRMVRLAGSDQDKAGRDKLVEWMKELDLEIKIDKIGNIFGIWSTEENKDKKPIMTGSHIDSVIDAGIYDGCYGVMAGLEVIRTLKENNVEIKRPLVLAAFTNEEGVRYHPSMMGSLAYVGGCELDDALDTVGIDGTTLREELKRIDYLGENEMGFIVPEKFIEAHIEQGPILDHEGISVGVVSDLQGIFWKEVTIIGEANHAGTTPTSMRRDAGLALAKINVFLRELAEQSNSRTTIGEVEIKPNAINIVPGYAKFTVDIRNSNKEVLLEQEKKFFEYLKKIEEQEDLKIEVREIASFEPVKFDEEILDRVRESAERNGFSHMEITSGAGQDAQMMSRICPTAMIFVPSKNGISHNPKEFTESADLENGANVLLDVIKSYVE